MQECFFMLINVHKEQCNLYSAWAKAFRKYAEELASKILFEACGYCIAISLLFVYITKIFTTDNFIII